MTAILRPCDTSISVPRLDRSNRQKSPTAGYRLAISIRTRWPRPSESSAYRLKGLTLLNFPQAASHHLDRPWLGFKRMCGIAGFVMGRPQTAALQLGNIVGNMNGSLRHRGPDDEGVWIDPEAGAALAHRRLSIIDLSPTGHQPMISAD